jgi:plasmid stabilization system protein ParE
VIAAPVAAIDDHIEIIRILHEAMDFDERLG